MLSDARNTHNRIDFKSRVSLLIYTWNVILYSSRGKKNPIFPLVARNLYYVCNGALFEQIKNDEFSSDARIPASRLWKM